jgi:hypothetical protein
VNDALSFSITEEPARNGLESNLVNKGRRLTAWCFQLDYGVTIMSTNPTVTTSKATVPSTRKSVMRIASASDYLGDGIDTLVEEAVQYSMAE